jgi:hypothetical protein
MYMYIPIYFILNYIYLTLTFTLMININYFYIHYSQHLKYTIKSELFIPTDYIYILVMLHKHCNFIQ